eukprot:scaffold401_cov399-Prasinococcus_capsulatus_cf.AAC.19
MYDKVVDEYRRTVKVPGFRTGDKVPKNLLVNHIGEKDVKSATIEAMLKTHMAGALDSVKERALSDTERIDDTFESLLKKFDVKKDWDFTVSVEVSPEVRWKDEKAYKNLKVKFPNEPTDEDIAEEVESELRNKLKEQSILRVISDNPVVGKGQVLTMDLVGYRVLDDGTEGEKVVGSDQRGFQLDTEDQFLPGFIDNLMGAGTEQETVFQLPFPDDWEQETLRGVNTSFHVTVRDILQREIPPMDDDIADKLVPGATTVDEARDAVAAAVRSAKEAQFTRECDQILLDALLDVVECDCPESLVQDYGRNNYSTKLLQMQAAGQIAPEAVETLTSEGMVNNYVTANRENFEKGVRQTLAVADIFEREGLQVSEEDLAQEVNDAKSSNMGMELDEAKLTEQAREMLEGMAVLKLLKENATPL